MDFKAHALYSLGRSRWFVEKQLEDFKKPSDWTYQPTPQANHALWIVGHLGLADNMFASLFREASATKPDGFDECFWFGSECKPEGNPAVDDVLAYYRERRENLTNVLSELSDAELAAAGPAEDAPSPIAGAPNMGHLFLFAAEHEMNHAGQLSVCRRGLGNDPMFKPS
ncbi:MAG: DinB family protein [Aeoliella sp.]